VKLRHRPKDLGFDCGSVDQVVGGHDVMIDKPDELTALLEAAI
jgi:hypothetical protein